MYKALKSFSGLISMARGEIREIKDSALVADLLKCGYIEEAGEEAVKEVPAEKKATKKKTKK